MSWHRRDRARFEKEEELRATRSQAELLELPGGLLAWREDLLFTPTNELYELVIRYPQAFPYSPPQAFIVRPSVEGAPHRLLDGSLCLFANPAIATGPKTTALMVRNRAIVWFWTFRIWQLTGEWAAPEHLR